VRRSHTDGDPGGSPQEEQKAISELEKAEILTKDSAEPVRDLMIRAYLKTDGIPSRIVNTSQGDAPVPDLTTSGRGRRVLDGLDKFIQRRVDAANTEQSERERSPGREGGHPPETASSAGPASPQSPPPV
jgi:hypothetical protein